MLLRDNLVFEGYEVVCVGSGEEVWPELERTHPDLILLDILLPGKSGLEICRELRDRGLETPVVMISVRSSERDRVLGLDCGADDYITKPISLMELTARVRAQLRRFKRPDKSGVIVRVGETEINLEKRSMIRNGDTVEFSYRECELLRYFVKHSREVLTRDELLREVWGYATDSSSRTVDTYVGRLRHKIEPVPEQPTFILTVHGIGYRFVP
jgi:DNA-binding response OmpR family regulator